MFTAVLKLCWSCGSDSREVIQKNMKEKKEECLNSLRCHLAGLLQLYVFITRSEGTVVKHQDNLQPGHLPHAPLTQSVGLTYCRV